MSEANPPGGSTAVPSATPHVELTTEQHVARFVLALMAAVAAMWLVLITTRGVLEAEWRSRVAHAVFWAVMGGVEAGVFAWVAGRRPGRVGVTVALAAFLLVIGITWATAGYGRSPAGSAVYLGVLAVFGVAGLSLLRRPTGRPLGLALIALAAMLGYGIVVGDELRGAGWLLLIGLVLAVGYLRAASPPWPPPAWFTHRVAPWFDAPAIRTDEAPRKVERG
jgi:hypothetical protein